MPQLKTMLPEVLNQNQGCKPNLPKLQDAKALETVRKFGSYETFSVRFNPDIQLKLKSLRADYAECFGYDYPTLASAARAYSDKGIVLIIKVYLDNLNDFCGVQNKLTDSQIDELAAIIFYDYYFLKISELALFFTKLKGGVFGEFYGTIDPIKIVTALVKFCTERKIALDAYHRQQEAKELEAKRKMWEENAITREEYLQQKAERRKQIMNFPKRIKRIKHTL